jgi:hypothetical protein
MKDLMIFFHKRFLIVYVVFVLFRIVFAILNQVKLIEFKNDSFIIFGFVSILCPKTEIRVIRRNLGDTVFHIDGDFVCYQFVCNTFRKADVIQGRGFTALDTNQYLRHFIIPLAAHTFTTFDF